MQGPFTSPQPNVGMNAIDSSRDPQILRSENGEYSPPVLAILQPWNSIPMLVFVRCAPATVDSTGGFSWPSRLPAFIAVQFARRVRRSAVICASIPVQQQRKARDSGRACDAGRS